MTLNLDAMHETICDNFTGMAEVRQAADALIAEVRSLRAKVPTLQVAVSHSAESCADGPCEFHETVARAESAEAKVAAAEAVADALTTAAKIERLGERADVGELIEAIRDDLRAALATEATR